MQSVTHGANVGGIVDIIFSALDKATCRDKLKYHAPCFRPYARPGPIVMRVLAPFSKRHPHI
jgi:hypothetical protein